eukprot:8384698-Ditylum_brightwellii.AAC.1
MKIVSGVQSHWPQELWKESAAAGQARVQFQYKQTRKVFKIQVQMLIAADQDTVFPEILPVWKKESGYVARDFNMGYLCRYLQLQEVIHINGSELVGREFQKLLHSYGLKDVPTTVKNLQANTIVKRMHLTIDNMLRMTIFEGDDSWFKMNYTLQAIAWALQTYISSSIPYSPGILAFNYDMIMQIKLHVDWEIIKKKQQESMIKNNIQENKKRIKQNYKVGDKVLIVKLREQRDNNPKLSKPTKGPYKVKSVHGNDTVTINTGQYKEKIHICRLKSFNK